MFFKAVHVSSALILLHIEVCLIFLHGKHVEKYVYNELHVVSCKAPPNNLSRSWISLSEREHKLSLKYITTVQNVIITGSVILLY